MVVKSILALVFATALGLAQGQVSLSGTVKDSRTQAALVGASVALKSLTLNTKTDTAGRFSLTGSSSIGQSLLSREPHAGAKVSSLTYRHLAAGPIRIRILNLSGSEKALLFSGFLPAGPWSISPPPLEPGVYLCAFEAAPSKQFIRFFAAGSAPGTVTERLPGSSPSYPPSMALAKSSADPALDTLIVTKNGYHPARLPLTTYQQSGLNLLLEDSASANQESAAYLPDPSWPCYMPDGIPPPALGETVFSITLQIGGIYNVGLTKFGQRRQYDIKGGAITGSRLTATVLAGGLDYELTLSNGSTEVEQINIFRANNIPILMRNAGIAPPGIKNARVVLDFEAPNSSAYAWLNTGKFAATRLVDTVAKTIRLDVYDISKATLPATRIQFKDPTDTPHQTWECFQLTGSQGTTVFTENVTLGTSISIGASKRGSRNIIPITGGTTTGRVAGKILNGGADYQLGGLDARYTLAPNDGEYIVVRNCGANGLVPVFEARVAGPYNFLNENKYLSSSPNVGSGSVSITFYEKK